MHQLLDHNFLVREMTMIYTFICSLHHLEDILYLYFMLCRINSRCWMYFNIFTMVFW